MSRMAAMMGRSEIDLTLLGVSSITLIALLNWFTPPGISFALYYALPILIIARVWGIPTGVIVACVTTLFEFAHERLLYAAAVSESSLLLQGTGRLAVMLIAIYAYRKLVGRSADLELEVQKRTSALADEVATRRHTELELRAMMAAMPEGVLVADKAGNILIANPQCEVMFGYPRGGLIDQPIERLVPAHARGFHHQYRERFLESGTSRSMACGLELFGEKHDGSRFPLSISVAALQTDEGPLAIAIIADITSRNLMERALNKSREELAEAQRVAGVGSVYWDLLTDTVEWSAQQYRIFGVSPDEVKPRGEELFGRFTPASGEELKAALQMLREEPDAAFNLELEVMRGQTNGWIQAMGESVRDASGAVIGIRAVNLDITERKRAEARATESLTLLEALTNTTSDAIYVKDTEGRYLLFNPAAQRFLGKSAQDVMGKDDSSLFPAAMLPDIKAHDDKAMSGLQAITNERTIPTTLGDATFLATKGPLFTHDGKLLGLFCISRDISEQAREREALRKSEAGLAEAQRLARVGSWHTDLATHRLTWSEEMYRFYGLNSELGPPEDSLYSRYFTPKSWNSLNEAKSHLATTGEPYELELETIGEDGKHRWKLTRGEADRDRNGAIVAMRGTSIDITERVEYERRLQAMVGELRALNSIGSAISAGLDLRVTLDLLLGHLLTLLHVDAAAILLVAPGSQTLHYERGIGFRTPTASTALSQRIGQCHAGRVAQERRAISIPHLSNDPMTGKRAPFLAKEGFMAYYGVPLESKGAVQGVLEIFHRSAMECDEGWIQTVGALASQASVAINNSNLLTGLRQTNDSLELAYDTTLEGWSHALELRDGDTEGHTQRVTEVTLRLARAMGIGGVDLEQMRRGALLHDIGKMGIPDAILLKPGPLTDAERAIIRQHPILANDLLSRIPFLHSALPIPLSHHERWDGTGYPSGLKGERIPLAARIFAVVDVWDALRSERPYRKPWDEERVRAHIRERSGTDFDPVVVEAFMRLDDPGRSE